MTRRLRVINDPDADAVKFPWHPVLDHACDPPPVLNALMDEALSAILLVSDGRTQALVERVTGSKAGTSAPTSTLWGEVEGLSSAYAACRSNRRRLYVLRDAQQRAIALRYAPNRAEVRGTKEWKDGIAADSRSCRVLAAIHGVSYPTISRIKKQARAAA